MCVYTYIFNCISFTFWPSNLSSKYLLQGKRDEYKDLHTRSFNITLFIIIKYLETTYKWPTLGDLLKLVLSNDDRTLAIKNQVSG